MKPPFYQCAGLKSGLMTLQKPQKLRHMLSQYGEMGRIYLAPEGDTAVLSRTPRYSAVLQQLSRSGQIIVLLWVLRCVSKEEEEENGEEHREELFRGLG